MALADPSAQYGSPDGGKGKGKEEQRSYLRVRITGLERNRKDLLIRFDASVSPPGREGWSRHLNRLN